MPSISEIRKQFDNFTIPIVHIMVNGTDISRGKEGLGISNVEVELSCGFEASMATFCLYNVYNKDESVFLAEKLKKYILLGSAIEILLGYSNTMVPVFYGFISKINFIYLEDDFPHIKVTCFDVKGIMMANNHSKQLTAKSYGEAVKEILSSEVYTGLEQLGVIKGQNIADTPDKKQGGGDDNNKATDKTIEMVCESDYEFIVRVAKRFNMEFFISAGYVVLREQKKDAHKQMEIVPDSGLIRSIDVEYDITGLVERVEARGMDTSKATVVTAEEKSKNKLSMGNKVKSYIKKTEKVYIDPTIQSKEDAAIRAKSIMEDISYRFGTLDCTLIGLPMLYPGDYVELQQMGKTLENNFYITKVIHRLDGALGGFSTQLIGKASSIEQKIQ